MRAALHPAGTAFRSLTTEGPSRSPQADGVMRFSSSQLPLYGDSTWSDRMGIITAVALQTQAKCSRSAHSSTVTSAHQVAPRPVGSGTPPCPPSHRTSWLTHIPGQESSRAQWVPTCSLAFTFDSTFSYFWDFHRAFTGLGWLCSWARSFSLHFF